MKKFETGRSNSIDKSKISQSDKQKRRPSVHFEKTTKKHPISQFKVKIQISKMSDSEKHNVR